MRADVARDPELLDLMAKAGCTTLYIGFESVDPAALKEMKKSQTVEEIRHAIREIRGRGIHVHGMFVFGFDTDTPETTRATVRFALAEKDRLRAVPHPHAAAGLRLLQQMQAEGRILDNEWDTYDAHHVKFRPAASRPGSCRWRRSGPRAASTRPGRSLARLLRGRVAGFVIGVYAQCAEPPLAAHGAGLPPRLGCAWLVPDPGRAVSPEPAAVPGGDPLIRRTRFPLPRAACPRCPVHLREWKRGRQLSTALSALAPIRKRRVFALVGKSGTGKSFKARQVAQRFGVDLIIDDGLLIRGQKILAGRSAKREKGILSAIKTAVFANPDQIAEVRKALAAEQLRRGPRSSAPPSR